MCKEILDPEVLAKVRAVAPKVNDTDRALVINIISLLTNLSTDDRITAGMNGQPYWKIMLAELMPFLGLDCGNGRIGTICRGLGLPAHRTGKGYRIAWNRAQLDILRDYFELA